MRAVELHQSALATVQGCLNLQTGEQLLVVTDTMQPLSIAEAIMAAARSVGAEPTLTVMTPREGRQAELPGPVAQALLHTNAAVVYSAPSIAGNRAVREARAGGARVAALLLCDPGTPETVRSEFIEASFIRGVQHDLMPYAELTQKISRMVEGARTARITSSIGTDITIQLGNKVSVLDGLAREAGQYAQLPVGTFAVAPARNGANGVFVVDVSIPPLGHLTEPITFEVTDGSVTRISGGAEADRLRRHLESFDDPSVYNCPAEWGIGTAPRGQLSGNFLEEERILGWAHIALGDDVRFDGGTVKSPVHLDAVLSDTSLELDGQLVVDRGTFLV